MTTPKQQRWTPEEDGALRRHYPRGGIKKAHHHLPHRTHRSIANRAARLGLLSGVPKGWVPLTWVAPRADGDPHALGRAVRQAERDGVLERHEGSRPVQIVPEHWAATYAEHLGEMHAVERRTRHWWTTTDIAARLSLRRGTVANAVGHGHGIARYLRGVESIAVPIPRTHYRWEPKGAAEAVRRYKAARS